MQTGPQGITRRSLFEQVAEMLRASIEAGDYADEGRLPTESQLARRTGVSVVTMRKALAMLAEQGLIVRRQGSGTFIRDASVQWGRSTRRRTNLIAYVSATQTEYALGNFFNRIMRECEEAADRLGYCPVLTRARSGQLPLPLATRKVDGALLAGTFVDVREDDDRAARTIESNNRYAFRLARTGLPVVAIGNYTTCPDVHCVLPDYDQGFADALAHLTRLGHRRIAFLNAPLFLPPNVERADAFTRQMKKRGLKTPAGRIAALERHAYQDLDGLTRSLRALLASRPAPTALIAADGRPRTVIETVQAAGMRVPRDISVIICSNSRRPSEGVEVDVDIDERVTSDMAVIESRAIPTAIAGVQRLVKLVEGHVFKKSERMIRTRAPYLSGETVGSAPK